MAEGRRSWETLGERPEYLEYQCGSHRQRRRRDFELLKRTCVEARYSANYDIERDHLNALMRSVRRLRDLVEQVSRKRLDGLQQAVAGSGSN